MDEVQDTRGESSLHAKLSEHHAGSWVELRRLHEHGVASGGGKGKHPEWHHGREVESNYQVSRKGRLVTSKWLILTGRCLQ